MNSDDKSLSKDQTDHSARLLEAVETLSQRVEAASLLIGGLPQWMTCDEAASWISAKAYTTTSRAVRDLPIEKRMIAGKVRMLRADLEAYIAGVIKRAPVCGSSDAESIEAAAAKRARKISKNTQDQDDLKPGGWEEIETEAAE